MKSPQQEAIYEVQDGFLSGLQRFHKQEYPVNHRQVEPTPQPTCSSTISSPCVPQGMTSLGLRPPQSVEGGVHFQRPLATKPNSSRALTVRESPPPAGTKVMDAPEGHHLHAVPCPLSLPHQFVQHGQLQPQQGNFNFQVQAPAAAALIGSSNNSLQRHPQGYDSQLQWNVAPGQQLPLQELGGQQSQDTGHINTLNPQVNVALR